MKRSLKDIRDKKFRKDHPFVMEGKRGNKNNGNCGPDCDYCRSNKLHHVRKSEPLKPFEY